MLPPKDAVRRDEEIRLGDHIAVELSLGSRWRPVIGLLLSGRRIR
jgi:hypothetical protein